LQRDAECCLHSTYQGTAEGKEFHGKDVGLMGSLRPKLSIDPLTGEPAVELTVETTTDISTGLDSIMRLISEIKRDIVFMFDEFQQIAKYPEKNTEAILRTVIQTYPVIRSFSQAAASICLKICSCPPEALFTRALNSCTLKGFRRVITVRSSRVIFIRPEGRLMMIHCRKFPVDKAAYLVCAVCVQHYL
jgi:hypothetical protein